MDWVRNIGIKNSVVYPAPARLYMWGRASLLSRGNGGIQLPRLLVERLYLREAHLIGGCVVEKCPDGANARTKLFEKWRMSNRRGKGLELLSEIVDQVALPQNGGPLRTVFGFHGSRRNLETAEPATQTDQVR